MLTASGATHSGHVRGPNEDAWLVDHDLGIYAVADGMGGHNAGEVASALALDTIRTFLERSAGGSAFTWPYGINTSLSFHGNRLMTAVKLANRRVFKAGESREEYEGLGTTVVAALIRDGQASFCGVGDSRIYSWRLGSLEQLTEDDSWVAAILGREATQDRTVMAVNPMRHVLTSAIGARAEIDVEVTERRLAHEETLLLSTDGLHGPLDAAALTTLLGTGGSVEALAQTLVQTALAKDGKDNITALVIRWAQDGN